jgi:hypothetical protein
VRIAVLTEGNQTFEASLKFTSFGLFMEETMGMDVIGRNPVDESGQYFRACVWEWRPLHELIRELCGDFVDEALIAEMQWNSGAGPCDPTACAKMAERFRDWLSKFEGESYFIKNDDLGDTPEGLAKALLSQIPGAKLIGPSAYSVDRETVAEWIQFLDRCGGFEVW